MAFIKTNRAESFEPVKKDDQKVASVKEDKSLLDKVKDTIKGR